MPRSPPCLYGTIIIAAACMDLAGKKEAAGEPCLRAGGEQVTRAGGVSLSTDRLVFSDGFHARVTERAYRGLGNAAAVFLPAFVGLG